MQPDDLISFSDAAREIGCSRTTLYRAVDDGRLNDLEVGGRRLLVKDEAWETFEPTLTGGRVRKVEEGDEDTNGTSQ
jgi:excisionase family DNA binding protein